MQHFIKWGLILFIINTGTLHAQSKLTYETVDIESYRLYEKGAWHDLLRYGKTALGAGQDFSLLRQRLGYAAFQLKNYSEAIRQYEAVLKNDSYNAIARYYIWWSRTYLNQSDLAGRQLKYFSGEELKKLKLKSLAVTGVGAEVSYKSTDQLTRGNTLYSKLQFSNRFGWNVQMEQAGTYFNQDVQLPAAIGQPGLTNVAVNQTEYYNKLTFNLNDHWQLKTAYHFAYTPFDLYTYYNNSGMLALKYNGHYVNVQAAAILSKLSDSMVQQYELQLEYFPFGNLSFYGFSTGILRQRYGQSAFNFRQVLGCQILPSLWLEAHATLGKFNDLLEKDALYLYNAVDPNQFKGGLQLYATVGKHAVLHLGYTFEERQLFNNSNIIFHQHSTTGGISWKW